MMADIVAVDERRASPVFAFIAVQIHLRFTIIYSYGDDKHNRLQCTGWDQKPFNQSTIDIVVLVSTSFRWKLAAWTEIDNIVGWREIE